MYFIGIDIGKRQHEACIIDSSGRIQGKMLRFSNTQAGGQKLMEWIRAVDSDLASFCVGMEATGHYWLALYTFLCKQGIRPLVINPIQSDAFRNMYIRQAKNDAKDAFIIAEILRFGRYTTTELANEQILALRQLSRFRFNLVDTIFDLKRQVIGILDILFPEYERLFSDLFGKTSSELLMVYTTPEEILAVDTEELAAFIAKRSRNRFGLDKAQELKSAAESSFGIGIALDAYRLQLRLLLDSLHGGTAQCPRRQNHKALSSGRY